MVIMSLTRHRHISTLDKEMNKVKQQRTILRIALYILRANGFVEPTKNHVLSHINRRNLMKIPDEDRRKRNKDDHDEIWKNDIAYKRKDLFDDGLIESPEHGKWKLSESGMKEIENKKLMWTSLGELEERRKVLAIFEYYTEDTLDWMLKIAQGSSLSLKTTSQNETRCPTADHDSRWMK
jgi:hypothetical protein